LQGQSIVLGKNSPDEPLEALKGHCPITGRRSNHIHERAGNKIIKNDFPLLFTFNLNVGLLIGSLSGNFLSAVVYAAERSILGLSVLDSFIHGGGFAT
jgi:hypothetical protein